MIQWLLLFFPSTCWKGGKNTLVELITCLPGMNDITKGDVQKCLDTKKTLITQSQKHSHGQVELSCSCLHPYLLEIQKVLLPCTGYTVCNAKRRERVCQDVRQRGHSLVRTVCLELIISFFFFLLFFVPAPPFENTH